MTTEHIKNLSMKALPYLINFAQQRKILTYKEIALKTGVHHRVVPHILGYIRDEICIPKILPIINAIVVNQQTKLPGSSFLPEGTEHLSNEAYLEKYEELRDQVFRYDGWDDLLISLNLSPIEKDDAELEKEGREYALMLERRGKSGEGPEHLELKNFVCNNPKFLVLKEKGISEYLFISGDRCDVVFKGNNAIAEIKIGERGELIKGIYQAVKYRSLLEAEVGAGRKVDISAFLVAYRIPNDIKKYAEKFLVKCKVYNS